MELFTLALFVSLLLEVAIIFGAILSLAISARIIRRLSRTIFFALGFAIMIFVINVLFGYSIITALEISLRFVAIVGSTSIFFLITSPDELEYVMRWFRFPRDLVFAFVTAVRFVPVLLMDALQIMDAQKSRGLELEKGNPLRRIRNFVPVLVPLVVNAVVRSGELAEAMESRAYGAVENPSTLYELKINSRDKLVIPLSFVLFIPAIYYFRIL